MPRNHRIERRNRTSTPARSTEEPSFGRDDNERDPSDYRYGMIRGPMDRDRDDDRPVHPRRHTRGRAGRKAR